MPKLNPPAKMSGKVNSIYTQPWPGIGDAIFMGLLAREFRYRYPNGTMRAYSYWPELLKHDPNISQSLKTEQWNETNPVIPKLWKEAPQHISKNYCKAVGLDLLGPLSPPYYMSDEEKKNAKDILTSHNCRIVIHARQRTKWGGNKDWPKKYWDELAQKIEEPVIQVGHKDEPLVKGAIDLRGLALRDSVAITALSSLFITCESGLYHITSGFNKKNIVIYGERSHPDYFTYPGDILLTGLYNCKKKYCEEANCPIAQKGKDAPCMDVIKPNDVLCEVDKALSGLKTSVLV